MFTKLSIMIIETNVMFFVFPVKWAVMFPKFNVMFLLRRIMFYTSLEVIRLRCRLVNL